MINSLVTFSGSC